MQTLPQFTQINFFASELPKALLIWGVFIIAFVVISVVAGFLVYHWEQYEVNKFRARVFEWVYFSVSFVLVVIALGGIVYYLYL